MKATSSDVNDHLPVDTQQQFCTSSMTATSARQQRTESRQRRARRTVADMVDDQLKSTQSLRPNVAVRTSRHLLLDKTTAKIGSRPPSATQGSSNFPMNQSDVIPVEVLHARRLKTAASSDPRNKPFGNILPTSAEEFFAEPYHMRPITASVSKAHSTPNNGATWRSKISKLYHDYDYQFTTSYRCAAVPPPPQRRISGTDGAVANDYEEDGLLRSQNGNGDIVWRSTIRTGSGRRSSMNRFNAAGNAVEIAAAANRKAISNASSLLSAMNSANATHRLKRGSAQATAPSLDSTDDAGAVPSLRPKSGRFAAAVAAVQKGRRGTETEDSIQQGIGQGGMRRPHMSIETRS